MNGVAEQDGHWVSGFSNNPLNVLVQPVAATGQIKLFPDHVNEPDRHEDCCKMTIKVPFVFP